jgi:ubiquinone/menaquinone biosynthesis C-methylase UbiE
MADYEAAIAPVKRMLFGQLADNLQPPSGRPARVLEIGIGTGPNLSYYPLGSGVSITGVDPNPYMLPYLRSNAVQLGWPEDRLEWVEGRAEALPLPDASVDAVVCTLVRPKLSIGGLQ